MSSNTVAQFAVELKMPANVLLEQLRAAGVELQSVDDGVTDADKAKLLESLRRAHGGSEGQKITLTRRQTSEIRQADGSGRSRTIQVEVRKKRVFVKRDPSELVAEAAKAAAAEAEAEATVPMADSPGEPGQTDSASPVGADAGTTMREESQGAPVSQTPDQSTPEGQEQSAPSADENPHAADDATVQP